MNFKLPIELIILGTILILWGIFMLSIHYRYKKRMKEIEEEWEARRRRWQLDEHDRRWYRMESEVPTEWIRRSATIPYDEFRPKTDKLSPHKKMDKHTMR